MGLVSRRGEEVVLTLWRAWWAGQWSKPEVGRLCNVVLWAWETPAGQQQTTILLSVIFSSSWRGGGDLHMTGWQYVDIITHPAVSMRILSLLILTFLHSVITFTEFPQNYRWVYSYYASKRVIHLIIRAKRERFQPDLWVSIGNIEFTMFVYLPFSFHKSGVFC